MNTDDATDVSLSTKRFWVGAVDMLSAAKKGLLVLVSALVAIFAIYELMLTEVIFDQAMTVDGSPGNFAL